MKQVLCVCVSASSSFDICDLNFSFGLGRQGLTRAIGVSNYMPSHLSELLETCRIAPMVNQVELHPRLQQKLSVCVRVVSLSLLLLTL